MQFAIDPWGKKIGPAEGPWGYCPECGGYVTAKRGEIVCHHFAHDGGGDCDPWAEHETAWHLN